MSTVMKITKTMKVQNWFIKDENLKEIPVLAQCLVTIWKECSWSKEWPWFLNKLKCRIFSNDQWVHITLIRKAKEEYFTMVSLINICQLTIFYHSRTITMPKFLTPPRIQHTMVTNTILSAKITIPWKLLLEAIKSLPLLKIPFSKVITKIHTISSK